MFDSRLIHLEHYIEDLSSAIIAHDLTRHELAIAERNLILPINQGIDVANYINQSFQMLTMTDQRFLGNNISPASTVPPFLDDNLELEPWEGESFVHQQATTNYPTDHQTFARLLTTTHESTGWKSEEDLLTVSNNIVNDVESVKKSRGHHMTVSSAYSPDIQSTTEDLLDYVMLISSSSSYEESSTSTNYAISSTTENMMSSSTSEENTISTEATKKEDSSFKHGIKHTYVKDKTPLEALIIQADTKIIGSAVKRNAKYESLKMIGMTLFIPTDDALADLPFDLSNVPSAPEEGKSNNPEPPPCLGCQSLFRPHYYYKPSMTTNDGNRKILADMEKLIMYHVVRRQIPLQMIEKKGTIDMKTELKGMQLKAHCPDDDSPVIIGDAKVTEVVHCKNGFIYKLHQPLTPNFNLPAPPLLDYLSHREEYSKLHYLLSQSHIFDGWVKNAGPITVLLIKNDGWKVHGLPVPDCFFKALVRPSNRSMLLKLSKWFTLPGLWTKKDIANSQWLPSAEAPALMVNHIYNAVGETPQHLDVHHTHILIEGKEVIEWDIPLHNGLGHVLAELPLRPDIDLSPILWDCLDFLCSECPIVTRFILKWLDNGGLLPDVTNPKAYIVPNGIRPDWVCSSHRSWFPPGWEVRDWKKYIEAAKGENHRHAKKLAKEGWTTAAIKREKLLDQYEEAREHLKLIWQYYHDTQGYLLGRKEDPSRLTGFLISHRDLAMKPNICEPRDRKFIHRHGFNHQTDSLIVDDEDIGLGYTELKYITQWI